MAGIILIVDGIRDLGFGIRGRSVIRDSGLGIRGVGFVTKPVGVDKLASLASAFGAFVVERYPFAAAEALDALDAVTGGRALRSYGDLEALRPVFRHELSRRLESRLLPPGLAEATPRVTAEAGLAQAHRELLEGCDGFLRRAALEASLRTEERREILHGMLLTRATDNRLKTFFTGSDI